MNNCKGVKMKQILVSCCGDCPYEKTHWSKPDGLIYEGRSCSHKDGKQFGHKLSLDGIKYGEFHKLCPLVDFNDK